MTAAPLITLNDGRTMPQLGLGTWPLKDREAEQAVAEPVAAESAQVQPVEQAPPARRRRRAASRPAGPPVTVD